MQSFSSQQPAIMGILNLTPDSFSDGGRYTDVERAIEHARQMVAEGAAIIDVGGESTRPGSQRVSAEEQLSRILDIIRALRGDLPADIAISVDTTRVPVAEAAIRAGANMLNDVSAGRDDPRMFALAAETGVPIAIMHMQGEPATMQDNPTYTDVVTEVRDFLLERVAVAEAAGIAREQLVIDPGIGFGKTRDHNLQLLAGLSEFVQTGYPVLLGTSRKRFMGAICQETDTSQLIGATCTTTVIGAQAGVSIFRVHDVRPNRQAIEVSKAIASARY
ncbi:dihydropteroate synthase [Methylohalomonas lacus]|uniref:Dihydropteroate synthase n=1 Tax=Methylohalomonas lacus TaxID=398773 RepID=A0AAE3HJZ6_9GAMM|nr:dihydropteroate synthase [Methylohalomonas lacus]MCS3902583.1 dihydropteroate synthase [Methylohalomonas lacus]